jgi:hypothetical protein
MRKHAMWLNPKYNADSDYRPTLFRKEREMVIDEPIHRP